MYYTVIMTLILTEIEFRDLLSFFHKWELNTQEPITIEIAGQNMIYSKRKMRN